MRAALYATLAVVTACWVGITATRVQVWQSELALWEEATARSPSKPRPWINLGRQYAIEGRPAEARQCFAAAYVRSVEPSRQAAERDLRLAHTAVLNLAIVAATDGDYTGAMALTRHIQPRAPGPQSIVNRLEAEWWEAGRAVGQF